MLVPVNNGKCYDLLRRGLELRFLCVAKAAHFFILKFKFSGGSKNV